MSIDISLIGFYGLFLSFKYLNLLHLQNLLQLIFSASLCPIPYLLHIIEKSENSLCNLKISLVFKNFHKKYQKELFKNRFHINLIPL